MTQVKNAPALTREQRVQVSGWMAAFRYGGKVDDLGAVDARHNAGTYNDTTWHIALDGATLFGFDHIYRFHLGQALRHGLTEKAVEKHAFNMTCLAIGYDTDVDRDWVRPEWATESAS